MWRKRTRARRIRRLNSDHSYFVVIPYAVMREAELKLGQDVMVFVDPDNKDRVILQKVYPTPEQ